MREIARILAGSRLYGTGTEQSDFDYKVLVLPPLNEIILGRGANNILRHYPQGKEGNVEEEIIPLQRFLSDFGMGKLYTIELAMAMRTGPWWMPPLLGGYLIRSADFTERTFNPENADPRQLMHALRFIEEIIELNTQGTITFPRPNAKYLRDLLSGAVPVEHGIERLMGAYELARTGYDTSVLPERTEDLARHYGEFVLQVLRREYGLLAGQK